MLLLCGRKANFPFFFFTFLFSHIKEEKKSSHMKGLRSLTEMLVLVRIVGTGGSSFDNEMLNMSICSHPCRHVKGSAAELEECLAYCL